MAAGGADDDEVAAGGADDDEDAASACFAACFAACLARLALISSSAVSCRLAEPSASSPADASASAVRFAAAAVEAGGAKDGFAHSRAIRSASVAAPPLSDLPRALA